MLEFDKVWLVFYFFSKRQVFWWWFVLQLLGWNFTTVLSAIVGTVWLQEIECLRLSHLILLFLTMNKTCLLAHNVRRFLNPAWPFLFACLLRWSLSRRRVAYVCSGCLIFFSGVSCFLVWNFHKILVYKWFIVFHSFFTFEPLELYWTEAIFALSLTGF